LIVLGLDSTLVWLSGRFTKVGFKPTGSALKRGESCGWVEGLKRFDVVRAPFPCTLIEANQMLSQDPRILNKDPYGLGWFVRVSPAEDAAGLLTLPEAARQIESRLKQLGVRCFAEFPDEELVEVGVECSAVLTMLGERLSALPKGSVIHLVSDDPSAELEMVRWSAETGNPLLEHRKEGELHHFLLKRG